MFTALRDCTNALGVSIVFACFHIEETDPSITWTGLWYTNSSAANSGGSAALTNARSATASIAFNGTGITWIGVLDLYSGLAQVYLDGTLSTIDTYVPATKYQEPLFVARRLAPGPHTFSIQVLHSRGEETHGSWIWIDGFDIDHGSTVSGGASATAGRVEQNDPALTYTGTWFLNTNPAQSGGTAVLAVDAWSGIATVYLDGTETALVDTYSAVDQPRSVVYEKDGLANGTHTLSIAVTGTHNAQSAGSGIWVDAFDVF